MKNAYLLLSLLLASFEAPGSGLVDSFRGKAALSIEAVSAPFLGGQSAGCDREEASITKASPRGIRLPGGSPSFEGRATEEGLWLISTTDSRTNHLRIVATAVGRQSHEPEVTFPRTGVVGRFGDAVRFSRLGLTEEYFATADGLRQDFVILERPEGDGELLLQLEVSGACATAKSFGAELTPDNGGVPLEYSRLLVFDAAGRKLPARMGVSTPHKLTVVLDDTLALYPVRVDPTFASVRWISLNGGRHLNGVAFAMVADQTGNIYIGGQFTAVSGVPALNVAKWDGTRWSAVGDGVNGPVYAMAALGDEVVVGGQFTKAGTAEAKCIARWNGQTWQNFQEGLNGPVSAVGVYGLNVYVGGQFTKAGNIPANSVARWGISGWEALGPGINGEINAIKSGLGVVYFGGRFTSAGGVPANNLAALHDESIWRAVGGGVGSGRQNDRVNAIEFSNTGMIVAGEFEVAGDLPARNVAKWNHGTGWETLGPGLPSPAGSVALAGGTLLASDSTPRWQGWPERQAVWRWDGQTWSSAGLFVSGGVHALASAGGFFFAAGGLSRQLSLGELHGVAKWDGSSWSGFQVGFINDGFGQINSMDLIGPNIYVGGQGFKVRAAGSSVESRSIGKWDGANWATFGTGVEGTVRALAVDGQTVYAGGRFSQAGATPVNNIARWNGTSWSELGNVWDVERLALYGNELFAAGGLFTNNLGQLTNRLARRVGSQWQLAERAANAVGSLFGDNITAVYATSLWLDGDPPPWEQPYPVLSRWTGSQWVTRPIGALTGIQTMAVNLGRFFAYGNIPTPDGPRKFVVNEAGEVLGGSVGDNVTAMHYNASGLYLAGLFEFNGQHAHVAKWTGSDWTFFSPPPGGVANWVDSGGGGPAATAIVAVGNEVFIGRGGLFKAVPNSAPQDVTLSQNTIAELGPPYAPVGSFGVVSPDSGDRHWFSFSGAEGGDDNFKFDLTVDGALFAKQPFDFETKNQYHIRVRAVDDGGLTVERAFVIEVLDIPEQAIITRQPESQIVSMGSPAALKVDVNGALPMTFQWRRNGFPMGPSSQSQELRWSNVQVPDEGSYDVIVCNAANCVTSTPAILKVFAPPIFTPPLLPSQSRQLEGTPLLRFQAFASGREPIQFRWYKDGQPLVADAGISGVDSFTLTLRDLRPEDEGSYRVVATNQDGAVSSEPLLLTIVRRPRITLHPVGRTRQVGEPMPPFTAEATGTGPMTYQWHKGSFPLFENADNRITGVDTPELSIRWLQSSDSGEYRVRVCNDAGCADSNPASLSVTYNLLGPGFLSAPVSRTNATGTTAIFTAEVWGTHPITNQWRRNGVNLGPPVIIPDNGGNPLVLTLPDVQPVDAGDYVIEVSNPAGSVTSLPARLALFTPPQITQQPQDRGTAVGMTVSFTVVATGSATLRYEWRKNEVPLANSGNVSGADTPTLTLSNVQANDAGGYRVVVINDVGLVTSAVAALSVGQPPMLTQQPSSATVTAGGIVYFTVAASGPGPFTFQWRRGGSTLSNGERISGATTPTLSVTGVVPSDVGSYDVVVENAFGSQISAAANLTVRLLPPNAPANLIAVSSQSTRVSLSWTDTSADETLFRIERANSGGNFTEISTVAANTTSFTDHNVQPGTRYDYRVRAVNDIGASLYSNVAEVRTQDPSNLSILPETLPVGWNLGRPDETYASNQIVMVNGQPFATALRVSTLKKPTDPWNVQVSVPSVRAVVSNELLLAVFHLRQVQALPGGEAQAAFYFEKAGPPWEKSAQLFAVEHLGEWRRYEVLFRSLDNYAAGAAQASFHLGFDRQVVDIGGVSVERYPEETTVPTSLVPRTLPLGWNVQRPSSAYARSQIVPVTGQPFTNAIRVTTLQRTAFPHEIQLNIPTIAPVNTGDVILANFHLRRASANGRADTRFVFERAGPPWEGSASLPFSEDTGVWQRFQTVFNANGSYVSGQAQLNFQLGFDPQEIEIGGVSLLLIKAPFITTQPVAASTLVGGTVSLTVTAVGAPLQYQWRKAGVPLINGGRIAGANSAALTLTDIMAEDTGAYDVVLSNRWGVVTSLAAPLAVQMPPLMIDAGDLNDGVSLALRGIPGQCSLVLRSSDPTGPWQVVATLVYGPDGTAIYLDGSPPLEQAFYRTEALPSGPPTIRTQPVSVEAVAASNAVFHVSVASCSLPTFQWRKDGVNLTGVSSSSIVLNNLGLADGGRFDVIVSNSYGAITSAVAVLTVINPP